jgi:D-alanyl-D-alanine carboxypeptidase
VLSPIQKQENLLIKIVLEIVIGFLVGIILLYSIQFMAVGFDYDNIMLLKNNSLGTVSSGNFYKYLLKKRPVYISLPGADKIKALVDNYTSANSIWSIVSKTHPISKDYIPESLVIPDVSTRTDKSDSERSVRSDIAQAVVDMFAAAKTDGYELMIGSGYRSAALQSIYFNSLSSSVGDEAANQSVARPGESEHQTGLALDISTVSYDCYLDNCFATTDGGQWLAKNSYKYGFILRYPEDKTAITGYRYESWHFRYVGIDLATALHQSGLTLDEAWPYLQAAQETLKKNGAI